MNIRDSFVHVVAIHNVGTITCCMPANNSQSVLVCCKSLGLREYIWTLTSMSSWYNTSLTSSLFLRLRPLKVKVVWPWTGLEYIHNTVNISTQHIHTYTSIYRILLQHLCSGCAYCRSSGPWQWWHWSSPELQCASGEFGLPPPCPEHCPLQEWETKHFPSSTHQESIQVSFLCVTE